MYYIQLVSDAVVPIFSSIIPFLFANNVIFDFIGHAILATLSMMNMLTLMENKRKGFSVKSAIIKNRTLIIR